MKRIGIIFVVLSLSAVGVGACAKKEEKAAPSTDGEKPQAVPATAKKTADKQPHDTDSAASKANPTETDKVEQDAGVEMEDGRITLSDPPKIDEIAQLAALLRSRSKEMDLREREITEREQMMSSLEAATMTQVDVLLKLKDEVSVLMAKLGKDFEAERKVFAEKQQKEEALRLSKEKEAATQSAAEAVKRQKLSQEMAAEREQRTVQLTAAIKGMRPSSGASMLASMDQMDAVAVLRQLGARQAAALLGNMPPEIAASLAEAMLGPKPTVASVAPEVPVAPIPPANDKNDGKKP